MLYYYLHILVFYETTYEIHIVWIKNCSHAKTVADIVTVAYCTVSFKLLFVILNTVNLYISW